MTPKTEEWSIYKLDTNQVDVLQLLCFIVCEQIKCALSLCLENDYILQVLCWNCASGVADRNHAIKPEWIYHVDLLNLPYIRTLYKHTIE